MFDVVPVSALLAVSGFVVGFLVGMTGVGAGSLTTPLLITGYGVHPLVAVGTDLWFASITKLSASWRYHRQNQIDWPVLLALSAGSIPGAILMLGGLYVLGADTKAMSQAVRYVLSAVLVVSALSIAFYRIGAKALAGDATQEPVRHKKLWMGVVLGLLLGSTVALTSIGAGAIGVAALTALFPALAIRRLIGTDIVHAIPLTMVCGLGHLGLGNVDVGILGSLLIGSIPGVYLGSRATGIMPERALRFVLAAIILYAAWSILPKH